MPRSLWSLSICGSRRHCAFNSFSQMHARLEWEMADWLAMKIYGKKKYHWRLVVSRHDDLDGAQVLAMRSDLSSLMHGVWGLRQGFGAGATGIFGTTSYAAVRACCWQKFRFHSFNVSFKPIPSACGDFRTPLIVKSRSLSANRL
jgi:hypothetical protein